MAGVATRRRDGVTEKDRGLIDTVTRPANPGVRRYGPPLAVLALAVTAALAWGARTHPWPAPSALALEARLQLLTTVFLGIVIEALPFLPIGVLATAAIQRFVSPERVRRLCPRNPFLAAVAGALLGLTLLPMCECGTVPTTRRLLAKGAPLPCGIAFLLAARRSIRSWS